MDFTVLPKGPLKSIKDIGFVEDKNAKHRKTMEDGHCMIDSFRSSDEGYFAIYDGHGGRNGVDHVQEVLHQVRISNISL
jgi:serine/threonine protein phosphatase PrpC